MSGNQFTYTELTPDEVVAILKKHKDEIQKSVDARIRKLETFLAYSAPSFTRELAAEYAGKSKRWIDEMRRSENLPEVKVGGHPRILRGDLDHLLCGGKFDEDGNQIPIKQTA